MDHPSDARPTAFILVTLAKFPDSTPPADQGAQTPDHEAPAPSMSATAPWMARPDGASLAARFGLGAHAGSSGVGASADGLGASQGPPMPAALPGAIVAIPTSSAATERAAPAPVDHAPDAAPAPPMGRINVGGAGVVVSPPGPSMSIPGRSPETPAEPGAKGPKVEAIPADPRRDEAAPAAGPAVTEAALSMPAPIGSDLIAEVRPFDGEGLDRVLNALLSRFDGLGRPSEGADDDFSQVVTVVAGALALEAARRWRNRGSDAQPVRGWSARSSSLRGFF